MADDNYCCSMRRANVFVRIYKFYLEGFKSMTLGKRLWAIILIKLFVFFIVMKLLFFPNILSRDYDNDEDRAAHVRHELGHR